MNYGYNFQQQIPQQMIPQQFQGMSQGAQVTQPQFGPLDRIAQLQYEAQMRDQQAQMMQMQQSQQIQQPQTQKLICVGSIEEAKGFLSPNDGSKIFFLNSSNNEIYSKQLDFSTGKSNFMTYKLDISQQENTEEVKQNQQVTQSQTVPEIDMSKYVSKDDYDSLKSDYSELKTEFNKFKSDFIEMWGDSPTTKKEEK